MLEVVAPASTTAGSSRETDAASAEMLRRRVRSERLMLALTLVALASALAAGITSDIEGARFAAIIAGVSALAISLTTFAMLAASSFIESREQSIRRYGATMSLRSGELYLEAVANVFPARSRGRWLGQAAEE